MQTFQERGGFHGNQHCYQQDSHESSRLGRHHQHLPHLLSQARPGYEEHSIPTASSVSKDCYSHQDYPSYSSSVQKKPTYRVGKDLGQHLQGGYSSHIGAGSGYAPQYVGDGQEKWEEPSNPQVQQYVEEVVRGVEAGGSTTDTHYLEQGILGISQTQCHHPPQPSTSAYSGPHQLGIQHGMYQQSHVHFPSQPPIASSSSTSTYMDKSAVMPHGYKGYGVAPGSQYTSQLANHSSLKLTSYRHQNSYSYQSQPLSRTRFESPSLSGSQEGLQKFQHFQHFQSPEQYYQNCSPSSSHSPARSVGRSPPYSSTPSPLMPHPETFHYSQPAANPGPPSSSSGCLQNQAMLMPRHSHSSPSVNNRPQCFSTSVKDRFSNKLLSNPSLWSLNALTSQVENISNNVQQLLLSETLLANKKSSKRNSTKKGDDCRGQLRGGEDLSLGSRQQGSSMPETQSMPGNPKSMTVDLKEDECYNSTEDYYYCSQEKGQTQMALDTVSSSVLNLQSTVLEYSLNNTDPGQQRLQHGEADHSVDRSPVRITMSIPRKFESNSPSDIRRTDIPLKENLEESAWTDNEEGKLINQQALLEYSSCFHKLSTGMSDQRNSYTLEKHSYREVQYKNEASDSAKTTCELTGESHTRNLDPNMKSENFKSITPSNAECTLPFFSRGNLVKDQYLCGAVDNSKSLHLSSRTETKEGRHSTNERHMQDTLEEQKSFFMCQGTKAMEENESLPSSEEAINNIARVQHPAAICCSRSGEQDSQTAADKDTVEAAILEAVLHAGERKSAICETAAQSLPAQLGFATLNEKSTPQGQVRDHIDCSDVKVLEPDSPQLPGKSVLHSASSWANTPPSPQKGDENMEPGISCPSAVTPSAKPEPVTHMANPMAFVRKHARGRRRFMIELSAEQEVSPTSPQKPNMSSSKSALFSEAYFISEDITNQKPKHENVPSRMYTRSFSALCAKSSPFVNRKPDTKPCLGFMSKGAIGHPKGLVSKIKLIKQEEASFQDDIPVPISDTKSPIKDKKSMVLRSCRKTPEKATKEKVPHPKRPKEVKNENVTFEQTCESLDSSVCKKVCRTLADQSHNTKRPSVKRKSSLPSSEPVKTKRAVKVGKLPQEPLQDQQLDQQLRLQKNLQQELPQPPLKAAAGQVIGSKKKSKRGQHFKAAPNSPKSNKQPSAIGVLDVPSGLPQGPTKTKYLPPRKGRGLKYEALVQKMTSPAFKKHPVSILQLEEATSLPLIQVSEQRVVAKNTEVALENENKKKKTEEIQDSLCAMTTRKKRGKWATEKISDVSDGVQGSRNLIITTPRLAKQRAIKNNHEMHMKQRRKRRKGLALPKNLAPEEAKENPQEDPLSEAQDRAEIEISILPTLCQVSTSYEKPIKEPPPKVSRRVRLSSLKKKLTNALGQHSVEPPRKGRKPGPKKKKSGPTVSIVQTPGKGPKLMIKSKKEGPPLTKHEITSNGPSNSIALPAKSIKPSFSPYVRMDTYNESCTIVNCQEQELVFVPPAGLISKAVPKTSVMLQGPLVNRNLTHRYLICCLCGKPANYRELGDLCGPYYPESRVPRKTESCGYREDFMERRARDSTYCMELPATQSIEEAKESNQDAVKHSSPHRKPKMKLKQSMKKLFLNYRRSAGRVALSRGLRHETEVKEHWTHEACTVWTNGVVLVAGKLFGLQEAVHANCLKCQSVGASVCCYWKGCTQKYHYICAKELGCLFLEDNFSMKWLDQLNPTQHRLPFWESFSDLPLEKVSGKS
uniref:Uncharacterized protein n=1 Tax=Denticeps clupeoides TaxID=299321 RepID=A0AAY4C999_9TELE